jgi:hypothetical protein
VTATRQDKRDLLKVTAFLGIIIVVIVLLKMLLGY